MITPRYRWANVAVASLLIVVLFTCVTLYINKQSNSLAFQIYEPAKIPGNAVIVKRTAEVFAPTDSSIENPTYKLSISSGEFYISQQKNVDSRGEPKNNEAECPTIAGKFGFACKKIVTNAGNHYILETQTDNQGKVINLDIKFVKGETYIWCGVNRGYLLKYSNYNWDEFVDSFAPTKQPGNLKINRFKAP